MSLRRKIFFKDAILLASLLLLIGASLLGLWRQRAHVQASLNEHSALHHVEIAQTRLIAFDQAVRSGAMYQPAAIADLRASLSAMSEYKAIVSQYDSVLPAEITPDLQSLAKAKTRLIVTTLARLVLQLDPPRSQITAPAESAARPDAESVSKSVQDQLGAIADLLLTCNDFVHRTELASEQDLHAAITQVIACAACMLLIAIAASSWQYRKVVIPLQRLRQWCRRAASGDFSVPYQPTSDREFQELAADVNAMAGELNAFYRKLESMVALKSKELVQSERLASVGYLAAGVAHEINNPLNIMSGYAELSLKRLRRLSPDLMDGEIIRNLSIIRGEAFRCKKITEKLLSLAKGNGDAREVLSLTNAVNEVVKLVKGLKTFRGKSLEIASNPLQSLFVSANRIEMTQVLLNLIINAIEAVGQGAGTIDIACREVPGWAEVDVTDDGRGMTPETIDRIFEPFFTHKRGAGEPGTGLGLSITFAIIADHGGQITAYSEGLNRGSRFTIRLPLAATSELLPAGAQNQAIVETVA